MDRRRQLPNARLSLLVAFLTTTIIVAHCHSSQIDPPHPPILDRDHHGGGQSRLLSLSAGSQIHGELLVSMPLTVFLPSLVLRRSLMLEEEEEETLSSTPSSNSSSSSLPTTSLERIFETLGIDSLECQKRFICEAMETPKRFEPLSNIIYILLRDANAGADRRTRQKFRLENFSHYREAFVAGQQASSSATTTTTTSCIAIFPNCHFEGSAARMLDFSILQYWQKLSEYLPLTITV